MWASRILLAVCIGFVSFAATAASVKDITTDGLKAWLAENPEGVLVDLRTPFEILETEASIKAYQNVNIPRGWLEFRIADAIPDKKTPIVVYCGTNQRSPLAAKTLMEMGYEDVQNYAAGIFEWKKAGLPIRVADRARDSILYSLPQKVTEGVYSAIGETGPPSYNNSGHNNNLSFIVTTDGVVVVNGAATYLLAKALHAEIRKVTDQPVKYVVYENGQGHATMGAPYWKEQGATIIAHADAASEMEHGAQQLRDMTFSRFRDKAIGSDVVLPDETFDERMELELGGTKIELLSFGPAHSPGDISVWVPSKKTVIAGDMAFHERLLAVFEETDTSEWLSSWEGFAALGADIVIPGHGGPTTMDVVEKYTRDYLVFLRERVGTLLEEGGSLKDAYEIDQSPYRELNTYKELARKNAGQVFVQMEFE